MEKKTLEQRIVVTGLGLVCPVGLSVASAWENMVAGVCGLREVTAFDTSALEVHRAGQIVDFDPLEWMSKNRAMQCGRSSQLAIAASMQALEASQFDRTSIDPFRAGICFGTTMGEPGVFDEMIDVAMAPGCHYQDVASEVWDRLPGHCISNHVGRHLQWQGPNLLIPTACAAGNYAIGYASDLLRAGQVDVMLAGGSDALSRIAFVGFHRLRAMSPDVVAPFDLHRKGMMIGEGAAALVLERLSDAQRRGAPIIAELLGYGLGCDAYKMTIPHPAGVGGQRALEQALQRAGIAPNQIDHINAHGTGTQENDRIETIIIKNVLGEHAYRCPMTSIKSMTGHCMGASSAIEAVVSCLSLQHGILPPTIHYQTPDPACDLDIVANQPRVQDVSIVVSNAYAFGGNTSTLVLGRIA